MEGPILKVSPLQINVKLERSSDRFSQRTKGGEEERTTSYGGSPADNGYLK